MNRLLPSALIVMIILAGCQAGATPEALATSQGEPGESSGETSSGGNGSSTADSSALPSTPQEVTFQASDGQALGGVYYPAAVNPAPLVVLMHWAGGDKSDWYEVAPWLQNRGLTNPFPNPGTEDWWDPTWFPAVPAEASYGVFIFSLRGCLPTPDGCTVWTPAEWLLDIQAAMLTSAALEGVDEGRIVTIGSSVGADGAPDGCAWLNEQQPGSCQGALSLSPGNYLDNPYPQVVGTLGRNQPPVAAWCLADQNEFSLCQSAEGSANPAYRDLMILDGQHGTMLLRTGLEPLPMQVILDFLAETVGP
jgi:hypothetical protein